MPYQPRYGKVELLMVLEKARSKSTSQSTKDAIRQAEEIVRDHHHTHVEGRPPYGEDAAPKGAALYHKR